MNLMRNRPLHNGVAVRPGRSEDLEPAFRKTKLWALGIQIVLPLFAGLLIFLADWVQHVRTADYFTKLMRQEVIRGGYREALHQAQTIVSDSGPFSGLALYDHVGREVGRLQSDRSSYFLSITITRVIFFSAEEKESAGSIQFIYIWNNVLYLSGAFLLLSIAITSLFLTKQRASILARFHIGVEDQRNKAVARMINSLAHDLQAPLNLITLALEGAIPNRDTEYFSLANQGLLRIQAMVESLKNNDADALVQLSYGQLDLSYLRSLAEGLSRQHQKNLEFTPLSYIQGRIDSLKFERTLQNLLVNAFEAAIKSVSFSVHESRDGVVLFEMRDDGPGVPVEIENRLFQRGATFGKAGGTGLGLSYVRSVVEGHGGKITYSRESGFSVFRIELVLGEEIEPKAPQLENNLINDNMKSKKIGIYINLDNAEQTDRLASALKLKHYIQVYTNPVEGAHCHLAYIYDLDQLDQLAPAKRQVIFSSTHETIGDMVKKVDILIRQYMKESGNDNKLTPLV